MDKIERSAFLKLFNRRGYVLDFSTNDFDIFTTESIGVPLCQKYGLSKGASLSTFCSEASDFDVTKLLFDLLRYYECHIAGTYAEDEDDHRLFEKCKQWFCQYHLTHFIRTRIMQRERYDHSRAFFGLPEAAHRWRCRFFC